MNLNVGCGEFPQEGWLNIDATYHRDVDGSNVVPDVIATIKALPFADDTIERVYLGHVLEHIPLEDCVQVLTEVRRVLRPGGQLGVVGPDINRARTMVAEGSQPPGLIQDVEAGGERWNGDRHWWTCEEKIILELLTDSGYLDIRAVMAVDVHAAGYPVTSNIGWQCAAFGTAP